MENSKHYDPAEGWTREEIRKVQVIRLQETLNRAAKSPFYSNCWKENGINPEDIKSLNDLQRLPFTTKEDLRGSYPDKLLCLPKENMVRLHVSSGTTGQPSAVMHTRNDLNWWSQLMARCMHMVGIRSTDVFQNMSGYGLFTGGLGIHAGAERLGCMTIPAGTGNSKRQIKLIRDFNVSVVHIIPSYAMHLTTVLAEMNLDPRELGLRIALIGAEPHTEETRKRMESAYNIKAYNSYGLSEMNGPGVGFECPEQNGLHVWEDSYIVEIINPVTEEPVQPYELGELVLTTLCREGMPIIRYRTKDLTRFFPEDCPCGRKHQRIDRITGRADDMIIIKGVNIYPMQIERVLMNIPEVGFNYLIILEHEGFMDQIRVQVEIKEESFVEDMRVLTSLQQKIASKLREEILISPKVELVEPMQLPRSEGKAVRVVDRRPKD